MITKAHSASDYTGQSTSTNKLTRRHSLDFTKLQNLHDSPPRFSPHSRSIRSSRTQRTHRSPPSSPYTQRSSHSSRSSHYSRSSYHTPRAEHGERERSYTQNNYYTPRVDKTPLSSLSKQNLTKCNSSPTIPSSHSSLSLSPMRSPKSSRRDTNRVLIDLTFEKIQLNKLLGGGATSKVYRATIPNSGFTLAVKIIQIEAFSPIEIINIDKEIKIMQGLSHPNIIKILGHRNSIKGNTLEIFLPFYDRSLREEISKNYPFKYNTALDYAVQSANGLLYLHSQSPIIIHRDFKSENILVQDIYDQNIPRLVITDFGEASLKTKTLESNIGTTEYMAPELITSTLKLIQYDEKVDIWSFGMLLYELITGNIPFHEDQPIIHAKIIKIIQSGIKPPLNISNKFKEDFNQLIQLFYHCTNFNCTDRPTSLILVKKLLRM